MKFGALAALNAVIRPKNLRAIGEFDGFKGFAAPMGGREGAMPFGMPVLCEHHMREPLGDPVDHGHDLIGAGHRQRSALAEAVLHVDHKQHVLGARPERGFQQPAR